MVPQSGKLALDVEHARRHRVMTVVQQKKWEPRSMQKHQTIPANSSTLFRNFFQYCCYYYCTRSTCDPGVLDTRDGKMNKLIDRRIQQSLKAR